MAKPDYYLKIEGPSVKGQSVADGHKDEIQVREFSWSAQQEGSGDSGSEHSAGKVNMKDLAVKYEMCTASPHLMLGCATGQRYDTMTLTARKAGKTQKDYLTITMTKVLVSKYTTLGTEADTVIPIDEVTLNFRTIKFEYKPQDGDSLGAAETTGFDKSTLKPL